MFDRADHRFGVAGVSYTSFVPSRDTDEQTEQVRLARIRQMSPEERIAGVVQLSEDMRSIAAAGIRARHPDYSATQIKLALFRLLYGDDLVRQVWPDAPLVAP